MVNKKVKKNYGVDLTFWSPKSVSIACLVGRDNRLEEAHRQSVSRTIDFLEEHYAGIEVDGEWVQTKNLVVLKQHHDVSRELDPELHTHCLVVNLTQRLDGQWVDLSYQQIWLHQELLGEYYHRDLALRCQKLGYQLEPDEIELFQLRGYTKEQLALFSKGGLKSCNRVPVDATDEYWRQCAQGGGLPPIEELKNVKPG
jgi:conjugative relaxase-like TrwC/TraI family protein